MSAPAIARRDLLKTAAAAAGTAALGRLASAQPAGADPSTPLGAGDRVSFGVIGVGGRGFWFLKHLLDRAGEENLRVLAVCDVYRRRLTNAKGKARCDGETDYRKLLDRKDIDAVLIATPDHWHAKMAIDAMDAGKHVYLEKPMTLTVEQALEVRAAVKRTRKVLQVGAQWTGNDATWKAREAIQSGRIGKVAWAQAGYNRNFRECLFNRHPEPVDPKVGPDASGEDHVDWDLWLGHAFGLAPKIPWTPDHFFHFRKYWPYNGGVATDLLYHKLAPLLIMLAGPGGAYPLRVSAGGGLYVEQDGRDVPDTFLMTADYPGGYTLFLESCLANDSALPDRLYGKHGTLEMDIATGQGTVRENGDMGKEFREKNGGQGEVRLEPRPCRDMVGNLLDVIRGRADRLYCDAELGAATMVGIKMGVEAYRQSKTLRWDTEKRCVVG